MAPPQGVHQIGHHLPQGPLRRLPPTRSAHTIWLNVVAEAESAPEMPAPRLSGCMASAIPAAVERLHQESSRRAAMPGEPEGAEATGQAQTQAAEQGRPGRWLQQLPLQRRSPAGRCLARRSFALTLAMIRAGGVKLTTAHARYECFPLRVRE